MKITADVREYAAGLGDNEKADPERQAEEATKGGKTYPSVTSKKQDES